MNWMSMGMDNHSLGPEEFAPVADEEDQSYLYRSLPDDPVPAPLADWRQAYWDYYFTAKEAGETPVAEAATVRYVLYCARCELFSAHVVPLGHEVVEVACPGCSDVFSC
jgi:hypothetical protein